MHAINAVAASLLSAGHSETAVFQAFSKQFVKLGLHGSINLVDPTGRDIVVRAIALPNKLNNVMAQLEKMINFSIIGYRYSRERAGLDNTAMEVGQAIFLSDNSRKVREVMPQVGKLATNLMLKYFAGRPAVLAPIFADEGKVQGVLYASGSNLQATDGPAIAAFANHISIALQNAILFQEMKDARASLQRVNASLAASRDAIHALVQQTPVGIQVFDTNGICVDVNEAYLQIFGMKRNQIVRIYNIFTDPFAARVGTKQAAERVLLGETMRLGDVHFDFERAEGEFFHTIGRRILNVTLFPVFGESSKVVQFVGLYVDVTEQKKSEASLRQLTMELSQQKQMVDAMLRTTPDSFYVLDINGRYLYASPRALEHLSMTLPEIIGKNRRAIGLSEALYEQSEYARLQVLQTGQPVVKEYGEWTNGEYRDQEFIYSPLHSAAGEIIGFVITVRDVTQRKREQTALFEAQKTESLGVLAGGIAHDFNNLLVAMLGQTSLALTKLSHDNPAHDHIQKAIRAAQKASELTRQMLAYSGRGKFEIRLLDLNKLIEENSHLLKVAMPKHVALVLHCYSQLPLIEADPGQIQQIVMNLLLNAAESMEDRPGTITITTSVIAILDETIQQWQYMHQSVSPGHYVLLRVEDDGAGIDDDVLQKIFDPFFTTKFTGRGLGLAAVLGIVRGHHGSIRVSSQKGYGTTFEIAFPISDKDNLQVVQPEVTTAVSASTGTILVIDDEEAVRDALSDMLESVGLSVITAVNGKDGIQQYQQRWQQIALILLDLSMPDQSGADTFTELRCINADVPILLISGYSEMEVQSHFAHAEKLDGFIQKPFDLDLLISTVVSKLPALPDES
ncbi:MAG: PAS domain S-box protein [Anaerolineales bacterium]|nr:PAS domain S-box protein [Anaerolineales bacterium]